MENKKQLKGYVAKNKGEDNISYMTFSSTLGGLIRRYGKNQGYAKVTIIYEEIYEAE
jgi:hypothetical protein